MAKRKNAAGEAVAVKSSAAALDPNKAALRCFVALQLSEWDCDNVLKFTGCVIPLRDCEFYGEISARHEYAQTVIRKWVALCLKYDNEEYAPHVADSLEDAAYDAGAITDWLSSIQPGEGETYCTGDERTCGYNSVLNVISQRLSNNCVKGREFQTALETEQRSSA